MNKDVPQVLEIRHNSPLWLVENLVSGKTFNEQDRRGEPSTAEISNCKGRLMFGANYLSTRNKLNLKN